MNDREDRDTTATVDSIGRAFMRRLLAVPEGRRFMLSITVDAEEGDESGVFDQLAECVDDPVLRRVVMTHRDDEVRHASLFRGCLDRNGWEKVEVPDEMRVIREVADGAEPQERTITTPEDIVTAYALLLVIEERGVQRFGQIADAFRPHDPETADTYLQVARDERGHVRYCTRIGRHYAADEAAWDAAVARARAREGDAFGRVGVATLSYAHDRGWVDTGALLAEFSLPSA
ncbi:MAG: hypothetical protein JWM89_1596 [Acidimicrobiales bacterium]|nr:hypothetical protein [Acidimicrobiales bacterium]